MKTEELYQLYTKYPSVQTDTRRLKSGDLFFALKGNRFNGNKFAAQAIATGAAAAIIDEKEYTIPGRTILVEDVLTELQQLAYFHRGQFKIPFLAITGSNGKTTTRELIHAVLSTVYKTYTTEGNLNNHIGIPLTLLKIKSDAEMAVIEMGANHTGEIASYCRIVLPDHGLITNCGKAHLEGFGDEAGVRKAKGELFDHLKKMDHSHAFVNRDDGNLLNMSRGISFIATYGTTEEADLAGKVTANDPFLEIEITKGFDPKGNIKTKLTGEYNLPNILAAVLIGKYFKVPETLISSAIEDYQPSNSRSQLIQKGSNTIILDAYNANPTSMKLAIENFAKMKSPAKVLMLGSMAELGKESLTEHKNIIAQIGLYPWTYVVLVGEGFGQIKHAYLQFENSGEARDWLQLQHFENTHLLIKGSRSIEMEKVLTP